MTDNYKELRSLLRADILDHPDKLSRLANCLEHAKSYYNWSDEMYYRSDDDSDDDTETNRRSNSPVLDAFIESNIVRVLIIPRSDALRVIVAFLNACCGQLWLACERTDMDRLAKVLYDMLHIQTPEGLVEDLTQKDAVYSVLYRLTHSVYHDMEDDIVEACTKYGLVEAFETEMQGVSLFYLHRRHNSKTITWDQERLLLDECKRRFDRARAGMCSLTAVQSFLNNVWSLSTQIVFRHPKELVGFKLESHPLIIAEVASAMLRYHSNVVGDIFSVWPDAMEQIVDAMLEWPRPDNLNYWASSQFIRHCLKEPIYAKRFSLMGSTKVISLMNLLKEKPGQVVQSLILTMVKYTPDPYFRVQLVIYPWHILYALSKFKKKFMAENILASFSETEHFKVCPKYILLVVAHLLKAFLCFMEQNMKTDTWGVLEEKKCAPCYDKARAALKIYEDLGAFEHVFPQELPSISSSEPDALKSFMLENCEEFARDYELYGSLP